MSNPRRSLPFTVTVLIACSGRSLQNYTPPPHATLQPDVTQLNSLDSYDVKWQQLMSLAGDVFSEQNDDPSGESRGGVLLVIFAASTWRPVTILERRLSSLGFKLEHIYCELEDTFTRDHARETLEELVVGADIADVFLFADSGDFLLDVMELVSNVTALKWTSFLNTAEWTVVGSSDNALVKLAGGSNVAVDFVTLVYVADAEFFAVAQKSRGASLRNVLKVRMGHNLNESVPLSETGGMQYEVPSEESSDSSVPIITCPFRKGSLNLRRTASIHLGSLKSSLDGLVLPVSILPEDEQDFLSRAHVGNDTVYSGYSIALLDTLASSMGFTYYMVSADDGGYYGSVLDNGDVSGISGQLARREAALSTMPLSMTESRRTRIDFVPIPIALEDINIIYKLPVKDDHLDLTYLDIFQPEFCLILLGEIVGQLARREAALSTMPLSMTESRRTRIDFVPIPIALEDINIIYKLPVKDDHLDLTYLDIFQPEFCLILLGPLIIAGILGAIIHVISNSCTTPRPGVVTRDNLKLIASFPDHICFHAERTYRIQSGLLLRTSWAVFWFIISSAYSAYLVTTFTIKPPDLALRTFRQLLDHPEFTFGMTAHDTALITVLRTSNDRILRQVWQKLYERNRTDPSTFDPKMDFHLSRVLSGGYAFVLQTSLDLLSSETYPDVRVFPQKDFQEINQAYVAVPKHTFYAKDVRKVLLSLEESGILDKLKEAYMKKAVKYPDDRQISSTEAVTFHRIELPVYFAVAGIALAALSLLVEILLHRCKGRRRYDVTCKLP